MDQKEQVRVSAVKSFSTLIPIMSARPLHDNIFFQSAMNYESYLKLMSCLILILTDEHPDIRIFIVNQGLNMLFDNPLVLESAALQGICIKDTNDYLAMLQLFKSLTTEASQFQEINQDPDAVETERFAQMDAIQNN